MSQSEVDSDDDLGIIQQSVQMVDEILRKQKLHSEIKEIAKNQLEDEDNEVEEKKPEEPIIKPIPKPIPKKKIQTQLSQPPPPPPAEPDESESEEEEPDIPDEDLIKQADELHQELLNNKTRRLWKKRRDLNMILKILVQKDLLSEEHREQVLASLK